MPKKSKQKILDDNANSILLNTIHDNYIEIAPINGNYPGIDGIIQIVAPGGDYTGKYLHYQLKGKGIVSKLSFSCKVDHLIHWSESNVPVLFILVDIEKNDVYWQYIDREFFNELKIQQGQKTKTIHLRRHRKIDKNHPEEYVQKWLEIATSKEFSEFSDIQVLLQTTGIKVQSLIGLLYLTGPINCKDKYVIDKIRKTLGFTEHQAIILLYEGVKNKKIKNVGDVFWIDSKRVGIESLHSAIESGLIDIYNVYQIYEKENQRKEILKHLAQIEAVSVREFFKWIAGSFLVSLHMGELKSNDDISVNLNLLEEYAYLVSDIALEITKTIITTEKPKEKKKYEDKFLGEFTGMSHRDLIIRCLEILEKLRYVSPKLVIDQLLILSDFVDSRIDIKARDVLKKFAEYNLAVLKQVGYTPQLFLLNEIEKWDQKKQSAYFDIIIEMSSKLLETSLIGQSMKDHETIVLHTGALPVNKDIRNIRKRTLEFLFGLYKSSLDLERRRIVLRTIQGATRTPHMGSYGDDIVKLIRDDTNRIIDFYLSIIPTAQLEIIKDIEEQINWFTRSDKRRFPKIHQIRSLIASNSEYEIFRVFFGNDFKFSASMDWEKAEKERKEKIQELLDSINEDSFAEWSDKIFKVVANYDKIENKGEFYYLDHFLFELGKQKPDFAIQFMNSEKPELEPFLIRLLSGLWLGGQEKSARIFIEKWVNNPKRLHICASIFDVVNEIDLYMATKIICLSAQRKDEWSLLCITRSIIRNMTDNSSADELIKLFVKTIGKLTQIGSYQWLHFAWHRNKLISNAFSEKQIDTILENILLAPDVDYHIETLLVPIAKRFPEKIIKSFHERVKIRSTMEKDNHYDAVPYKLHLLNSALAENSEPVIDSILEWYKEEDGVFHWEADQMLKAVFPDFGAKLENKLIQMVKTMNKSSASIVLDVLEAHLDGSAPDPICKELIKNFKNDDEIIRRLSCIISNLGTVWGEYGFVKSLKARKQHIETWSQDQHKAVRDFSVDYIKYLDERISYEKKRTDEQLALRKSRFEHDSQ
ncbi:DUF4365 domain-containing protein [bacterium]|nr:DUF4365 domain-containing protein [bacterium]